MTTGRTWDIIVTLSGRLFVFYVLLSKYPDDGSNSYRNVEVINNRGYTCVTCVDLFVYGVIFIFISLGSSASTLTCYGDDKDSIRDRDRSFDFRCSAHTGSESHTMDTGNIVFRQDVRSRNLTNHSHLVPMIRMCGIIPPFALNFMACCFNNCISNVIFTNILTMTLQITIVHA